MGHWAVVDFSNYLREVNTWYAKKVSEQNWGRWLYRRDWRKFILQTKSKSGKNASSAMGFGGKCRKTKDLFSCSVPDHFSKILLTCLEKLVKPNTMTCTNCWAAHKDLNGHRSYFHADVNHSKNFKNLNTGGAHELGRLFVERNQTKKTTNCTEQSRIWSKAICASSFRDPIQKKKLDPFENIPVQVRQ